MQPLIRPSALLLAALLLASCATATLTRLAFANVALENATGRDLGGHILDAVAPRQRDAGGPQLAGGSWISDPQRYAGSPPAPAGVDPAANLAVAPATEPQTAPRARTRSLAERGSLLRDVAPRAG